MTDFETLKSTLKEEILKELSSKTEGHELKTSQKTRKTKKNEEKTDEGFTATQDKPVKPKRKCTEKQLAALAAGRQKNPRWIAKRMKEEEAKKKEEEEKKKLEEEKKSE